MNFFIFLFVSGLVAYLVYRMNSRSYGSATKGLLWGAFAFVGTMLVLPILFDQIGSLVTTTKTKVISSSSQIAY